MKMYHLAPLPAQHQKSFYGKAYVTIEDNGEETLYSYDTPIIRRNEDGTYTRLYDGWTVTTGRHIKAFCDMNKKEYEALPF